MVILIILNTQIGSKILIFIMLELQEQEKLAIWFGEHRGRTLMIV